MSDKIVMSADVGGLVKEWKDMSWDEKFADVDMRARYWTEGGCKAKNQAEGVMAVEQSVNAWKNCAYAVKDALTSLAERVAEAERLRDEAERDAKRWNAVCDRLLAGKSLEFTRNLGGIEGKIIFPTTRESLNEALDEMVEDDAAIDQRG